MHATKEEVDTEVGDDDREESKDEVKMTPFTIYRFTIYKFTIYVQRDSIDHQGDECPDFLGIPSPIAAPTLISPDGAKDDACCKKENSEFELKVES